MPSSVITAVMQSAGVRSYLHVATENAATKQCSTRKRSNKRTYRRTVQEDNQYTRHHAKSDTVVRSDTDVRLSGRRWRDALQSAAGDFGF